MKLVNQPVLSEADQNVVRLGTGYVRDWEKQVFAALNTARDSDVKTSGFIFGLVQQATDLDAAGYALEALERKWVDANEFDMVITAGKKAGTTVKAKPPVPASWRVHKSSILTLCKSGPELAGKVDGDLIHRAIKALHLSGDAIRKMYNVDGKDALSCRNERYAGQDGLAVYRKDIRDVRALVTAYGSKEQDGTGNGQQKLPPLPDTIQNALAPFMRAVREANDAKVAPDMIASIIAGATESLSKLATAKNAAMNQNLRDNQRKSAIADKRKSLELDRAEAEAEKPDGEQQVG